MRTAWLLLLVINGTYSQGHSAPPSAAPSPEIVDCYTLPTYTPNMEISVIGGKSPYFQTDYSPSYNFIPPPSDEYDNPGASPVRCCQEGIWVQTYFQCVVESGVT